MATDNCSRSKETMDGLKVFKNTPVSSVSTGILIMCIIIYY